MHGQKNIKTSFILVYTYYTSRNVQFVIFNGPMAVTILRNTEMLNLILGYECFGGHMLLSLFRYAQDFLRKSGTTLTKLLTSHLRKTVLLTSNDCCGIQTVSTFLANQFFRGEGLKLITLQTSAEFQIRSLSKKRNFDTYMK